MTTICKTRIVSICLSITILFYMVFVLSGCSQGQWANYLVSHEKYNDLENEFKKGMSPYVSYEWMHITGNAYRDDVWEATFRYEDERAFEIFVENGLRLNFAQTMTYMGELPKEKQKAFAEIYLEYASKDEKPHIESPEVLACCKQLINQ